MSKRICLRCGYCCLTSLVVVVVDPDVGLIEGNCVAIDGMKERCPHLQGDTPGEYSCLVHDREWFLNTPCHEYNDTIASGFSPGNECMMGKYILGLPRKDVSNG